MKFFYFIIFKIQILEIDSKFLVSASNDLTSFNGHSVHEGSSWKFKYLERIFSSKNQFKNLTEVRLQREISQKRLGQKNN